MENTSSSAAQPNRANGMANLPMEFTTSRATLLESPSMKFVNSSLRSGAFPMMLLPTVARTNLMRTLLFSPARTLSSTAVQAKKAE